jgi:hypothetical protein
MPKHATCPLCGIRSAKRDCPALDRRICAVCCATKRLVEIRCPPTCPYLSSSRAHPAAVVQRRLERDLGFFLPIMQELSRTQYELVLFFQAAVHKAAEGASPALRDEDVVQAAGALAATFETAGKGLIYEHQAQSVPAQRLLLALRRTFQETLGNRASDPRIERDAAVALRRIETAASRAAAELPGDDAPVYLGLVSRMLREPWPAAAGAGEDRPESGGSGLIVTG